ncbi:uncharacterized protein LOC116214491 [Punica granatum]|uniref:Prolamin-like domain-containing protein n=2 Tax=Punica granatum TaxID=22663 RepID=A0A218WSN7_PUNGR|nr:uncharacterized protein LOC116214491 [Punica granatum]OWM74982.1 hypothetical protein CDL15_Pgr021333 [Punica granatum]PKI77437.1 hypothetical protein CRG98_002210 [Punica granatum]
MQVVLIKSFGSLAIFFIIYAVMTPNPTAAQVDWRTCGANGLTTQCGQIISSYVILNEGPLPNDDCCRQLLKVGKPCHDAYVQAHIDINDFEYTIPIVIQRRDDVWVECLGVGELVPVLPPVQAPAYPGPAEAPKNSGR